MAVYTSVSAPELESFLTRFDVGALVEFAGISSGIENTNYFVTTEYGRFVLTLFEVTPPEDLPFCLDLMAFLAEHDVPSAHPIADEDGGYLQSLCERPAALVKRLSGQWEATPDAQHCAALGAMMGRMHRVIGEFDSQRANERGLDWHQDTAATVSARLSDDERRLLDTGITCLASQPLANLPSGVIHADLFRDNALFLGHEIAGIIDFYYAHNGAFIYDIAVAIADWCFTHQGALLERQARAFIDAYHAERRLNADEIALFAVATQLAGLRFWLSRRKDELFPREGELTQIKDPTHFRKVMEFALENPDALRSLVS